MNMNELMAKREGSKERCGLILKSGEIIELDNRSPQPEFSFAIDGADVIKYINEMTATWHTHIELSELSGADYVCFRNWPLLKHYIVGSDGVKCYKVKDNTIYEDEPE